MEFDFEIESIDDLLDTKLPNSYLLKYYQDLKQRTFWISEEIDADLVYELTHYILKWNREDKGIEEIDRKPIYLMFDCPGGSLDSQASICSLIFPITFFGAIFFSLSAVLARYYLSRFYYTFCICLYSNSTGVSRPKIETIARSFALSG